MSLSAFAGQTYTWTGNAGNNLYADRGNWTITNGTPPPDRFGPSWTDAAYINTDTIGKDVTIILNTNNCHPDVFQTKGPYKVTLVADANNYTFGPYWMHLYAKDHEFDVNISMYGVNNGYRNWLLYSSATFKKDVYIPDNTTIDNRSNDGTCLGVSPNAIHFYGKVTVASGKALGLRRSPYTTAATVHFHGPLVCDDLRFGLGWSSGYAYFYSQENQIGSVNWAFSNFVCENDNVYPTGNTLTWPSSLYNPANNKVDELYWDNNSTYTAFNLNGYNQTVAKIDYQHGSRRPWINSGNPATLTLNGSGSGVANVIVGGKVSLVVDSTDLVQDFRNSQSTTSGSLEARRGTLRLSEATSFVNVKELVIGAGATFDLASTATGSMGGLTNVTVAAGGTLKVGSGVNTPFGSELSIRLSTGAFIETDANFTVANGLYLDGELVQSGTYSTAAWLKGSGKVSVNAPGVEATYVWTGNGGDGRISNANNWNGGVLPSFTSPLSSFVVPVVGSDDAPASIVVDTPMTCKSLHFCSETAGLVVVSAVDDGKLTVVKGEVNATNDTANAVIARLNLPVEFEGSLTVRSGSDDKDSGSYGVYFPHSLNSIGKADISKYGYGVMVVEGDANVIQGNIHNYQGAFRVHGENPIGGGSSYSINNYPDAGDVNTILVLQNATVNRNVVTRNPSDQCGPTIRMNGTVTVNGNIGNNAGGTSNSGHMRIHVGMTNMVGPCRVNGNITAHNNGFFILTGAGGSLTCDGVIDCVRFYCDAFTSTTLDIAKLARGLTGMTYAWYMKIPVRISIDNCICRDNQGDQCYMCYSSVAGIDLNGHTLTLNNFGTDATSFAAGGCYIKGGAGSKLTLVGDIDDSIGMHILESASLVRSGTGTTTIADACTSTGTLDVIGGTVRFTESGSWASATCVTVGGGTGAAKLALGNRKAFGKKTVLKVADNGKVEIPEGVTVKVHELWLNGVKQTMGLWGSSESGASEQSAFFEGKGRLLVGDAGFRFIIR